MFTGIVEEIGTLKQCLTMDTDKRNEAVRRHGIIDYNCHAGLREAIAKGVLAGYPMVDLKCTLFDGKYHPVDSKEVAFVSAAKLAYDEACRKANPVLLEPIYQERVVVPESYMGDILGDMNKRRGRILGMDSVEGKQVINAEVPLAEMFKYATDLRSMTQGRGSFEMSFVRYEQVPPNVAAEIIARHQAELEAEQ